MKKLFLLSLFLVVSSSIASCGLGPKKEVEPTASELELRQELQELREERQELQREKAQEEESKERAEMQKVIDALNAKIDAVESKEPTVVKQPVVVAPAKPAAPKYGPGDANNTSNFGTGYVKVVTASANGKLTLRETPSTNSKALASIYNGTTMSYYSYQKVGDYVWYNVDYTQNSGNVIPGWVRGDFLTVI